MTLRARAHHNTRVFGAWWASVAESAPRSVARPVVGATRFATLRWASIAALSLALAGYAALAMAQRTDALLVDYDPSTQYLLDSLGPFRGSHYLYVDHPGTPLEVVGTLVLLARLVVLGGSVDRLIADTLARPEQFFLITEVFLLVATLLVLIALARWSVPGQSRAAVVAGLFVAGLYFAAHSMSPLSLTWWTHNSFAFVGETLLGLFVLMTVRTGQAPGVRRVVMFGLCCGVLAAVQIYFAAATFGTALAIAILLRQRGARTRIIIQRTAILFVSAAAGFLLATAPTAGFLKQFLGFLLAILLHQGEYGKGPAGFTSPSVLSANLVDLARQSPLLFALVTLIAGGLVRSLLVNWDRRRSYPTLYEAGPAFLFQTAILIFVIAKHPAGVYLLSVAAMLPLLAAVWLEAQPFSSERSRRVLYASTAGLGLLVLGNLVLSAAERESEYATNQAGNVAVEHALAQIAMERGVLPSSMTVLWGYGTANQCFSLWYGEPLSGPLVPDLESACAKNGELNVWSATPRLSQWDVAVVPEELLIENPVLSTLGTDQDLGVPSLHLGNLHLLVR
jgi:hypothetical protein